MPDHGSCKYFIDSVEGAWTTDASHQSWQTLETCGHLKWQQSLRLTTCPITFKCLGHSKELVRKHWFLRLEILIWFKGQNIWLCIKQWGLGFWRSGRPNNVDYISINICINGTEINGDLLCSMEDLVMLIAISKTKTNEEKNTTWRNLKLFCLLKTLFVYF